MLKRKVGTLLKSKEERKKVEEELCCEIGEEGGRASSRRIVRENIPWRERKLLRVDLLVPRLTVPTLVAPPPGFPLPPPHLYRPPTRKLFVLLTA